MLMLLKQLQKELIISKMIKNSFLIITHYQKLLDYILPDFMSCNERWKNY